MKYEKENIVLHLEPVECEDQHGSLALNILLEYGKRMDFVSDCFVEYNSKGVWVSFEELNNFEAKLRSGLDASLRDLSENIVLEITKNSEGCGVKLFKYSPVSGERASVSIQCSTDVMSGLYQTINNYEKWW